MPNKQYRSGRAREYRIKKKLEAQGWIVVRTAGSHGFCDLIAIKERRVRFLQVKPKSLPLRACQHIQDRFKWIDGLSISTFEVVSKV